MSYSRVHDVQRVGVALTRSIPPDLIVTAKGRASTTGWTDPHLTAWIYVQPPKDGILDFDFVAKAPTGIVLQVLTDIIGSAQLSEIDIANYWGKGKPLKGVRVHAVANSTTYRFPTKVRRGKTITV